MTSGTSVRLNCTIASLQICNPGTTCPYITVQVRPGGNAGSRSNSAQAISTVVPDPNLGNNDSTVNYTIDPRADVTVTKAASPTNAVAGQNVQFVLTASNINNGTESEATNVVVADVMPPNMTFVSALAPSGSCPTLPSTSSPTGPGNNTVSCTFASIANGAQRTVTITARPNLSTRNTSLVNNVAITTDTTETNTANNSAQATITVAPPAVDLLVNKVDSVDPLAAGDDTVYTITVRNGGPSAAENFVMTETLPPNRLDFRGYTVNNGGTCAPIPAVGTIGGTFNCSWPYVEAGQTNTVTVTMRGTAKGVTTNNVSVSSDEVLAGFETVPLNNATSQNTTVRTKVDIDAVSKVATPNPTNLLDNFNYVITVHNKVGTGLAEADNVVVTDNLPANMRLTGTPTVSAAPGTTTLNTCTGAAGSTGFTCQLGTVSIDGTVLITVPVEVTSITSTPQTFTNSASVSTSSLDISNGNNSTSGNVAVRGSSIAGRLFRDFNDDSFVTGATDTGVGGVTVTLSGTSADGVAVNRTLTTNPDGTYNFALLPEGTYTITRGAISETYLTNGTNTPGTAAGTSPTATQFTNVSLPGNTTATGYLFAVVPQARVAIAKQVQSGPTVAADGTYNVTFRLRVSNPSLEALDNMAVTDVLAGSAPLFGNHVALPNPGSDAMVPGSYTVLGGASGSCGSFTGGFNGSANTTIANGFTLAAGGTCDISYQLRVKPTAPMPPLRASGGRYENQAEVTAEGALSGQSYPGNPQLSDLSDNGANADPNGNGQGNEAGENDPTPVAPNFSPSITLVKVLDTSALSTPVLVGDLLQYTFTVENTGNITLANVTVAENLIGATVSGGPITLEPGQIDTTTFTATYPVTLPDLNANQVTNQATATGAWGTDGAGNPVTVSDDSGTDATNDDPIVFDMAGITLIKTADASAFSTPAAVGDLITYSFEITNTGNLPLTNVTITDILPDVQVTGTIATLAVGATDTTSITATYALKQQDIDAKEVENSATVTGTYGVDGAGNPVNVTDVSGSDATNDDPTVVAVVPDPSIELIKSIASVVDTNANGLRDAGDTVNYMFTVRNTGNLNLANVTVTDPKVTMSGGPISLAVNATNASAFTATYLLLPADLDLGYFENTAKANGDAVDLSGNPVNDAGGQPLTVEDDSDTGTDPMVNAISNPGTTESPDGAGGTDADPTNDPTVLMLEPFAGISLVKSLVSIDDTNGSGLTDPGDTVNYAFVVRNTGNVALQNVIVTDPLVSVSGAAISLPIDGVDNSTFTASYLLQEADMDRGFVDNTAQADGDAVNSVGNPVVIGGTPLKANDTSELRHRSGRRNRGCPGNCRNTIWCRHHGWRPDKRPDGGSPDANSTAKPDQINLGGGRYQRQWPARCGG